jgi:hypothetical protein
MTTPGPAPGMNTAQLPASSAEAISGLQPAAVWELFAEMNTVPRPSKHEEKIVAHMAAVAVAENTILIGAPNGTEYHDAVYPYRNHGNGWIAQPAIESPQGRTSVWFGESVAMRTNYVVIGAMSESDDVNQIDDTGAVYVGIAYQYTEGCQGDIAGAAAGDNMPDGQIGMTDFNTVLQNWGVCGDPSNCPADIVGPSSDEPDGVVDYSDFSFILTNWGLCASDDNDGDGIPNNWEILWGFDPEDFSDANLDSDQDGLTNEQEYLLETDPTEADSDGDDVIDGAEVLGGSDPNDGTDQGIGPESDDVVYVRFQVGDTSNPDNEGSETWQLVFNNIAYGMARMPLYTSPPLPIKRGHSYPVRLKWVSTTFEEPDYDSTIYAYYVDDPAGSGNGTPLQVNIGDPVYPQKWVPSAPVNGIFLTDMGSGFVGRQWDQNKSELENCESDPNQPCNPNEYNHAWLHACKFSTIKGLYTSEGEYEAKYTSEDDLGRIYSNREYYILPPYDPIWTGDQKQYIDLRVNVGGGALPTVNIPFIGTISPLYGVKIHWAIIDPDDPSNAGLPDAQGAILDSNDYDGTGQYLDNNGDDNDAGASAEVAWEQLNEYETEVLSGNIAETDIDVATGKSGVRLNVSGVGGDNYIVKVSIKVPAQQGEDGEALRTGIMTVWKRIDLEHPHMSSGYELPVNKLNDHFEKAFLEWNPENESLVLSDDMVLNDDGGEYQAELAAYTAQHRVHHQSDPLEHHNSLGWYYMVSALRLNPSDGQSSELIIADDNAVIENATTPFPGVPFIAGTILLTEPIPAGKTPSTIFIKRALPQERIGFVFVDYLAGDRRKLMVRGMNYHPQVDNPNSNDWKNLADFGFPLNSTVEVDVASAGAVYTAGTAPYYVEGDDIYFTGVTYVFKHGEEDGDEEYLATMIHEVTHALGMAHICGFYDYTGQHACTMNYWNSLLKDDQGNLVPGTSDNVGLHLCAHHIRKIRKSDLANDQSPPGWRILGW